MLMKASDNKLTPQLRFPEFKNSGEWEEDIAKNIFMTISEKNHSELSVLAATQEYGMLKRDDINYKIQYNNENTSSYKKVSKGDFVIHLRSFQGGFAYSDIEGITSPAYTVFRIQNVDKHYPYFWKYIFSSIQFIKKLELITYGVRDGRSISFKDFSQFKFLFPPLKEQKKIAEFLSSVDELLEQEKIKLENLKEYKKGLLQNLFPKENQKVPDLRFPEFKNSGYWEEKQLGELTFDINEHNNSNSIKVLSVTNTYGIVEQEEVFKKIIASEDLSNYKVIKKGDIAYNPSRINVGSVDILHKYELGIMSPMYVVVRCQANILNNVFLKQWLISNTFYSLLERNLQGGVRKSLPYNLFKEMKILIPSLKEQQKIADFLSSVDELIIEQVKKIQILQEYKQGLLQKLFL